MSRVLPNAELLFCSTRNSFGAVPVECHLLRHEERARCRLARNGHPFDMAPVKRLSRGQKATFHQIQGDAAQFSLTNECPRRELRLVNRASDQLSLPVPVSPSIRTLHR